jgi:hypothetical protein
MGAWWRGTSLVAERGLVETLRSRSFKVITGLLLLLSVAAVTIPQILGGAGTTYTIATAAKAPAGLVAALNAAGKSADFTVKYISRRDVADVRQAVGDGDATAGLPAATLYTSAKSAGTFPVVVAQAVVSLETSRRLTEAGLSPQQVADLQSIRPPKQVIVGRVDNEGRAGAGFAVGIVLYLALTFAGSAIATTVAMEKSTRISEVLLAVLRPSQVLVGTVTAVGAVTLGQLLVLATPLAVAVQVSDKIGIPTVAAGDIGLAVAWFVLGFALRVHVRGRRSSGGQDHRGQLSDHTGHDHPRRRLHAGGHGRRDRPECRLEHRGVDVPTDRAAGNADQVGLRRGPRLAAPDGHGTDRRHRGAARLGRLVHLSPRPAHHRSPGQAARGHQQPGALLTQAYTTLADPALPERRFMSVTRCLRVPRQPTKKTLAMPRMARVDVRPGSACDVG